MEKGRWRYEEMEGTICQGGELRSGAGAWCVQMADAGSDNIKWYFLVTE